MVDRAKGKLMDDHGLSEGDAFSFIQKTAMRQRRTMKEIGEAVLERRPSTPEHSLTRVAAPSTATAIPWEGR